MKLSKEVTVAIIGALGVIIAAAITAGWFNFNEKKDKNTYKWILSPVTEEWGKRIPKAKGYLTYNTKKSGFFEGTISLQGLTSNNTYLVSINGKSSHPSNNYLVQLGENKTNSENYLDFKTILSDDNGKVFQDFCVELRPGKYNVKLFVKDVNDKYSIVLFNNNVIFTIY